MNLWVLLAPLLLGLPAIGLWLWLVDPLGPVAAPRREAALWVAVGWTAFASLTAFALSIGAAHDLSAPTRGHLTQTWVVLVWLVPAIAGALVIWRRRGVLRQAAIDCAGFLRSTRGIERYLCAAIAACVLLVTFVALISAPTTWDSMTYHLARVAAWLQLGGASHYATSATPQLFQPPGAELLIAHFQALTGSDRFASVIQTVAYALVIVLASLVAHQLGGGRRAQLLASFLAAATPMAIMQGSSTQNDLLVGLWLMLAAGLALTIRAEPEFAFVRALVACAAVALALLTKGTAWIYLPPILLLMAYSFVGRLGWKRFALVGVCGIAIVLAVNAAPWLQNHQTFGKYIFSDDQVFNYSTDSVSPGTLASNVVRNGAIYLGTPVDAINSESGELVARSLKAVGADPDDPSTVFFGASFEVPRAGPQEAHGPSILLALLLGWSLALVAVSRAFRSRERTVWAVVIVCQILLFSLLIKWQPWHSRLHLPVVLMSAPLIGVALATSPSGPRANTRLTGAVVAIASLIAASALVFNVDRPLIGYAGHSSILTTPRTSQYFAARPELERPYRAITDELRSRGSAEVAIVGSFDDWYYPLSALLGSATRTDYALVDNESARYPQRAVSSVDSLICLNCIDELRTVVSQAGLAPAPGLRFIIPPTDGRSAATVELWRRPPR